MSAGAICSRVVVTVAPAETIRTAVGRMEKHDVGTLLVVHANGPERPVGIVTDRDIAIRAIGGRLDPDRTPVSAVMSAPVTTVDEDTPIEEALSRMAGSAHRRVAVTAEGGRVVGMLSLDDVLELVFEEGKAITHLLEKQRPHLGV